jgi:hypothetical protein
VRYAQAKSVGFGSSIPNSGPSGSGMNSVSPGTGVKRPLFQFSFACSMRSRREETKFHQM